jgi:signal transduction histidine kinase
MILCVWGVLGLSYIQGVLIQSMAQFALQYANQMNLPGVDIEAAINNAWLIFYGSVFLNCLMAIAFGIYISHRFLGPATVIRQSILELKSGNYSHRKSLRKGDELADVMSEVNALAEVLEKKYGSSPKA